MPQLCGSGDFTWSSPPWGIKVTTNSPACPIEFPGGVVTGNVLEVYYEITPSHHPQLWALQDNGFWRQASPDDSFLTSYRLFRYYSRSNECCDRIVATRMAVLGTNSAGELLVRTEYRNDSTGTDDQFRITGDVVLEHPTELQSALRADVSVSNASGHAVTPFWVGHRDLAEQWVLFGLSSMYVADQLTTNFPAWYDTLDPSHQYVGVTNDASFLNDGYSVNSGIEVSTHDAKYILFSNGVTTLDHDTNVCPIVTVPGYTWYQELVALDGVAPTVVVQHAYRSSRNHHVEVLGCSGLTANTTNLKWSVTYNRSDANMVDGDNIQIRLGMDGFLDAWPADAVQALDLRLVCGSERPAITSVTISASANMTVGWSAEPGEKYDLAHAPALGGTWSNLATGVSGAAVGPLAVPPGFLRIAETNEP